MTIRFNARGSERKRLAEAVANHFACDMEYKGAPTFAYQAGCFTIDRNGDLVFDDHVAPDEISNLLEWLMNEGFESESPGQPSVMAITVAIKDEDEKQEAYKKIEAILISKGSLFKRAVGAQELPVSITDEGIEFAWFSADASPEETLAYRQMLVALVNMAKNQQRVVAKERPVVNEKYTFRCFLLRLGFIGDNFKTARKILLKNFEGSSAYKVVKEAV